MNPLSYNRVGETGIPLDSFNCGGFALGTFEWYDPDSYDVLKYQRDMPMEEKLEYFAEDLMRDCPHLIRVDSPRNIPKRFKVIGFRLDPNPEEWDVGGDCSECEDGDCDNCVPEGIIRDFHFILRYKGVWYHKPGPFFIRKFVGNIYDPWGEEHDMSYDSEILWFIDKSERFGLE